MGANAVIYGVILGPPPLSDPRRRHRLLRHNRAVLRRLPLEDGYPPLSRPMFEATHRRGLMWCDPVIHFGWSTKNFAEHWPAWRGKFEGLLTRLFWVAATVHVEAEYDGSAVARWSLRPESVTAWWASDPPQPHQQWVFSLDGWMAGVS